MLSSAAWLATGRPRRRPDGQAARRRSGSSSAASRRSRKSASRRPDCVTSIASKPPRSIALATTSAPPRITSPRFALDPRDPAALARGQRRQLGDQLLEGIAAEHEALDAVVEVADDGVGGADPDSGSGLSGLRDRAAALDGSLQVESESGGGTKVRAELPLTAGEGEES